jgi:purine-binding chemotaxis protein CheW
MKKSQLSNQNVMKKYLSELLTDDIEEPQKIVVKQTSTITIPPADIATQRLEKLLEGVEQRALAVNADNDAVQTDKSRYARASAINVEVSKKNIISEDIFEQKQNNVTNINEATNEHKGSLDYLSDTKVSTEPKEYRQGKFQAMFFEVAGLIIAVPLIELGGIHNVGNTTSLMGKPSWFKGVMIHREEQISVVDTALWVMPDKCDDNLLNSLQYQYVIMLGSSKWGLLAEKLVDTVTLEQDDVKWLDKPSKRPWLAGLVKDKMCALMNVDALIKLLDDGASI